MSFQLWSQSNFSKGELSPYMYARSDVQQYFIGMKTAQNVLTYPSGAAGKRFGSYFKSILTNVSSTTGLFFQTFQYANECTYQLVWISGSVYIYLEGILIFTVTGTGLNAEAVDNLDSTVLGTAFRVSGQSFVPKDLVRSPDAANVITAVGGGVITLTTPFGAPGLVLPVQITTTGTLPTTTPPLNQGVTYFIKMITTTTVQLYSSSFNAYWNIDPYILTNNGAGVNTMFVLNSWALVPVVFKNLPIYDFDGGYDAITFTPSAVTGSAVTITMSAAYTPGMSLRFVGGAFIGAGGVSRITGVTDATHFTVAVQVPFDSTAAILGSLCFLAEPAWSTLRGWPQKCSSYQNRSLFANTASLPNGFWASAINDYGDFDDIQTDDDNAISWFPTSDDINYIRFIVPYRSITVHTNSGIYSSPLSEINAITPKTFTLQLQDSTPADVLQPRAIDNQIIILSGNDVHTMLWDGINNAYTSDIVSVVSEQLIRDPVDEDVFADLSRAGSRYVLIINANGTMAVYQTLLSQSVGGFTPMIMEQSYGSAQYVQVATNSAGRCWFVCERQIAQALATVVLTNWSVNSLTAPGINFSTTVPTAAIFSLGAPYPTSVPQIVPNIYYWCVGVDANEFKVYTSQEDAIAGIDAITFTAGGIATAVTSWPLVTVFTLEELTQDVRLDCVTYFNGTPATTFTTGSIYNAQAVKMLGDGFGFDAIGEGNQITFNAHGEPITVTEAYIGFPINMIIEPMPLTSATSYNQTPASLTRPKHIRDVRFMFNNTIGGTINGTPIALGRFDAANIGYPPIPQRGIYEISVMKGWDDFNNPTFTIEHNEPFDIQLLGVFYAVDI